MSEHDVCNDPTTAKHTQVPYTTKNGVETTVDANLAFTLEVLKLNGVETFYSCEDNHGRAYILANGRDMLRLERRAWKLAREGRLSRASVKTIKRLFGRRHSIEFSHFTDKGQNLRFQFHYGEVDYNAGSKACVTKSYSTTHGFRTNMRWPASKTSEVTQMLAEVMPDIPLNQYSTRRMWVRDI